jgi:hypothetical protein
MMQKKLKGKLLPEQVRKIRRARGTTGTRVLSEIFGVTQQSIRNIWARRKWAWLE